jgi:hypothetical protein
MRAPFLLLGLLMPALGFAQSYTLDWYNISGGGGTSTNAIYQVSGTIGQPQAGGVMSGGAYSVAGGFWSLLASVQTPGLPNLTIVRSGTRVVVSWPNTANVRLQTNTDLANPARWNACGGTVNTAGGTNSIAINPPAGTLFFRLAK